MAKTDLDNKGQFLVFCGMAPFAVPIITTFALLLAGNHFPRNIAADSSLGLAGFVASIAVMIVVNIAVAKQWRDPSARKFALAISALTSLMAWPVWTVGVSPSINGIATGPSQTSPMRLTRLDVTHASKSQKLYYWATLDPDMPQSLIGAGRYFIPFETYEQWQKAAPRTVRVSHATGLLGAEIVLGYH